ncbi:MAG: indole-3-glycerol phosphate synthase TrpC [Acidobacteriota bacterium]
MSLLLQDLVDAARETSARQRELTPEPRLRAEAETRAAESGGVGRFRTALQRPGMAVIAEVKGASPLSGILCQSFDPLELARAYAESGAAAISVLTEEKFFAGALRHLEAVSAAVPLPTLRKDFVVEPYQIYQAATAGASAVLLISDLLAASQLRELVEVAHSVGLDALVELHRPALLEACVDAGSGLIGVNNRNLDTMDVELAHSLRLAIQLPREFVRVSESGISTVAEVRLLRQAGYDAVLVGTALVRAEDPGAVLRELVEA